MTVASAQLHSGERAALLGLAVAGAAQLVFVAATPWIIAQHYGYLILMLGLVLFGLVTLLALKLAADAPARAALFLILGVALAMRLLLVGHEPFLSTDIFRYIWDGRVQAAGINPYVYVPADPALATLRDAAIYPYINRADYAVTAYPPVAEMFFLAVTRLAESLTAMRLAMIGCEAVIVAVIIDLARTLERPVTAVVAYAWHPLAIFEVASSAHVEALMVALLMLGVWLLVRMRAAAGAVFVALATLAKPYAVFALPAFWRPWDWRAPLAAIATVVLCYLPYLGAGRGVFGFMGSGYASEEGLLDGSGLWLPALAQQVIGPNRWLVPLYLLIAAGVMAYLALRVSFRRERTPQSVVDDVALLLTVALFFVSPNYAWYVLALVPFLALGRGAPIWAYTLAAFALYRPVTLPDNDLVWKTIAILPFIIAIAVGVAMRGRAARVLGVPAWTK